MLSVKNKPIMLSVFMLNVIILRLSVIMLIDVATIEQCELNTNAGKYLS